MSDLATRNGGRRCLPRLQTFMLLAATMLPALGHAQNANVSVPLMLAPDPERQGFVRIINKTNQSGVVRIVAFDDAGTAANPIEIQLAANQSLHFNSEDLADGNAAKGISGIGRPPQGHWRLSVETALQDVRVLAFVRTRAGFLTAMHDVLPRDAQGRIVAEIINPGSNATLASRLRLVNAGANAERVSIAGVDDRGTNAGPVTLTLAAGQSRTISAFDLENGAQGLTGTLGDGDGKWRLLVTAGQSVVGMSLLETQIGPITNLSTTGVPAAAMTPTQPDDDHGDSFVNATNLAVDGRQSGRIDPAGESDYFRVRVSESGTLTVYTTGNLDTRGYLHDSNERQLQSNDDGGANDGDNFRIEREVDAGTYYVRVEAYYRDATGDYTVHAELESSTNPTDDHGNSFADATNLAIGGQQSGSIDPAGDADYFRVRVSEAGTLTVYATGSMDNRGVLYDSAQSQLASNDDGGQSTNFRIEHSVSAGTYYVLVRGYSSSTTGSYTVHAEFSETTEPPEPPPTQTLFGAIATTPSYRSEGVPLQGGISWGYGTRQGAADRAIQECGHSDCIRQSSFNSTDVSGWKCGAGAHGYDYPEGWTDRQLDPAVPNAKPTLAEAQAAALRYCRGIGLYGCELWEGLAGCADGSHANSNPGVPGGMMIRP